MTGPNPRALALGTLCIFLSACSASSPADQEVTPPRPSAEADSLPPPGYGTLRQDDFTVGLQRDDLQVKVTPLHEEVIRLAAPDTYQRLHGLVGSRLQRIDDLAQRAGLSETPGVYLVSFFTRSRQAQFEPTGLNLLSQGILYRHVGILPLTPEWGRQQVKQEETQSALYLFDPAIDLDVGLEVEYKGTRSSTWSRIISTLQAERARVRGRVKS